MTLLYGLLMIVTPPSSHGMMHSMDPTSSMMLEENLIMSPNPLSLVPFLPASGQYYIRMSPITSRHGSIWPRYWTIYLNHVTLSSNVLQKRLWHLSLTGKVKGQFSLRAKSLTSSCAMFLGGPKERWDCYENGYLTVQTSRQEEQYLLNFSPTPTFYAVVQMGAESSPDSAQEFMAFYDPMDPHSVFLQSTASGYWLTWSDRTASSFRELTLKPLDYPRHSFRFEYVENCPPSTEQTEESLSFTHYVIEEPDDRNDDMNPHHQQWYLRSSIIN